MNIYVRWYDFTLQREDVLEGEVVDNSSYAGTQWQEYVLVRFKPQSMKQAICHHFKAEKVSQDRQNVPHDDCYQVCGGKISEMEQKISKMQANISSDDALPTDEREQLEAFKRENWDMERNHLRTDKLDEFYQLWRMFMVPFGFVEAKEKRPAGKPQDTLFYLTANFFLFTM